MVIEQSLRCGRLAAKTACACTLDETEVKTHDYYSIQSESRWLEAIRNINVLSRETKNQPSIHVLFESYWFVGM